jgi:hypothetical protein
VRLGVVIADTYPDKQIARFAVERTLRELPADECLLLSDSCFVEGARHVPIRPLSSLLDYNKLILDRLPDWVDCDAYLVVQWDGFALDGRRWRAEFLDWDYVGAPWPHMNGAVGVGGFSLRSRRLMEALCRLRLPEGLRDIETAEDLQICFRYRPALEAAGVRIADPQLAAGFAFERLLLAPSAISAFRVHTFGFHGVFNFPLVLAEDELLVLFDSILTRMNRSAAAWYLFVWHAWQRRYQDVGIKALAALADRDATVWGAVAQTCLRGGMSPRWLKGL